MKKRKDNLISEIEEILGEKIECPSVTHDLPRTMEECKGTPYFYPFPNEGTYEHDRLVERGKEIQDYTEKYGYHWVVENTRHLRRQANDIWFSLSFLEKTGYSIKRKISEYKDRIEWYIHKKLF